MDKHKIERAIREVKQTAKRYAAQIAVTDTEWVFVGKGDGTATVIQDETRRIGWVHRDLGGVADAFTVIWGANPPVPLEDNPDLVSDLKISVQIGKPPKSTDYYLLDTLSKESIATMGGSTLTEQRNNAAQYPTAGAILDFRLAPAYDDDGNPTDKLYINEGSYRDANRVQKAFAGDETASLSSIASAIASGKRRIVVAVFDIRDGSTALLQTGDLDGTELDEDSAAQNFQAVTVAPYYIVSGLAHVAAGATTYDWDDIYTYNPRVLFTSAYDNLRVSTANVSSPPSLSEINAAFGTPSDNGTGAMRFINDNGAGTAAYLVVSDGSNWHIFTGAKAT
jgi:hypothetical protein